MAQTVAFQGPNETRQPKAPSTEGCTYPDRNAPQRHSNDHEALSHTTHHASPSKDTGKTTLLQDIAEDLGLPTSTEKTAREIQQAVTDSLPESFVSGTQKTHTRKLDGSEVRGVWLLFGLLAGSWFAGGIFSS